MALEDRIIGVESGGDPNARNPNSTAVGPGQFLEGTWLATLSKYRPDLVQGRARDEVLALRTDPALARDMTAALAGENAGLLSKAGVPVTPGTTYLAHFAGPGGAVGILNADPSASVESILGPRVVAANSFLKGMTAADLAKWADGKMGGQTPPATGARPSPVQPLSLAPIPADAQAGIAGEPPEKSDVRSDNGAGALLALAQQETAAPRLQPMLLPPRPRPQLGNLRQPAQTQRLGFSFRG